MTQLRQTHAGRSPAAQLFPNARFVATPRSVAEFARYFHKSPDQLGSERVAHFCCICSTNGSLPGGPFREPGRR